MVSKDLSLPIRLMKTEVLARRLVRNHIILPKVEKDLAKRKAGYYGEEILMNYVKQLPPNKYYIFHDLELEVDGVHFQIDTLLLSRQIMLIIGSKNLSGTLIFDNAVKQLIRINYDSLVDIFEDPRVQAKCHQLLLYRWAAANNVNFLPIDYLVFICSPKTKIEYQNGDFSDMNRVCKGRDVFLKIDGLERHYDKKRIESFQMDEINDLLLKSHKPKEIDILQEYSITSNAIRLGAICPECFHSPMTYENGVCKCPVCKAVSKEAFFNGLIDFSYLYKPTITNSEFREFLQLPSIHVTQKALHSFNLQTEGERKKRIYFIVRKGECLT